MSADASSISTADDELYDALYDVKREAEEMGNYIDHDPYPTMNALRGQGAVQKGFMRQLMELPPFHRHSGALEREGYTCFTFEACEKAFRDNVNLSNNVYHFDGSPPKTMGILEMDNPEHHAFRRAVQSLFIRPKAQKWWREHFIDRLVDDLVTDLERHDRAELNLQLCARVPVHTITRAVGLKGEDALIFRNALVGTSASRHGVEVRMQSYGTVQHMLMEQIVKRKAEPGEDIISWLLAAEIDPPGEEPRKLTDQEIVIFARLILLAGGGTTWRQLGIVLLALLSNREYFDACKADRKLIDAAIEESLRWNPTNPTFSRVALVDTELCGVTIPQGAVLDICLGAANRDPAVVADPDRLDIRRSPNRHLAFGYGPHQCVGMGLARLEGRVAIGRFLQRFPNYALAGPAVRGGRVRFRGYLSLGLRRL